jgi:hypothetical protein
VTAFIVQLEPGVWLANWCGDPGRTCVEAGALRLRSLASAERELAGARKYRPFVDAQIVELDQ